MTAQEHYDDAMFDFSTGDYATAVTKLKALLADDPTYFDAQLSLGMAYYRLGDYASAIAEGHKAEQMQPNEQLVHTNLSLFYMKSGDKQKAEHYGLQARVASWKKPDALKDTGTAEAGLEMANPAPPPIKFPTQPWKKTAQPLNKSADNEKSKS